MERDYQKELANFARVWQRVKQSRGCLPEGLKLMPGKTKPRGGRGGPGACGRPGTGGHGGGGRGRR